MIFTVPCAVFARMSKAALQPHMPDKSPFFPGIRSVRLENNGGHVFMIATNRNFLTVEYIGVTKEPDGFVNVDLAIAPWCEKEVDTNLTVTLDVASGWAVAVTSGGYFHPMNASVVGEYPDWRALIPTETPTASNGILALDMEDLRLLWEVSPSGSITLPKFWDVSKPIIVRDFNDAHWFGMFLSLKHRDQNGMQFATRPDWLK